MALRCSSPRRRMRAQDPKFSPDGNHVAYLRKHNLYVQPLAAQNGRQLTDDTDENILNGEVDWVYAEELGVRGNYFWSPDSKEIAFLQMNEKQVPTYPITDWLPTHPKVEQEKYPKVGDPNPEVRLGVVSAKGGKPKWISLTKDTDIYIPRFGWVREGNPLGAGFEPCAGHDGPVLHRCKIRALAQSADRIEPRQLG